MTTAADPKLALSSRQKKPKKDLTPALDAHAKQAVKTEKGVGRGQKRGPRGLHGQPMKYRKRAAGTAGAAGKQRIKAEGSPPNLDDAGIG